VWGWGREECTMQSRVRLSCVDVDMGILGIWMRLEVTSAWDVVPSSLGYIDASVLACCPILQVSILNKYSEAIRGNLTKIMRLKIVALVTIEIHARDVLEKLYKSGLMDVSSFDWLSQLRFYWEKVAKTDRLAPLLGPD
jgi:hypothetical protein